MHFLDIYFHKSFIRVIVQKYVFEIVINLCSRLQCRFYIFVVSGTRPYRIIPQRVCDYFLWWFNWHLIVGVFYPLRWRHNGCHNVSNHQPHHCLLNRLFRRRSKKTSKLRVTGLCAENSPGTGEFPAQMASNAKNVSIWWRHHAWESP